MPVGVAFPEVGDRLMEPLAEIVDVLLVGKREAAAVLKKVEEVRGDLVLWLPQVPKK